MTIPNDYVHHSGCYYPAAPCQCGYAFESSAQQETIASITAERDALKESLRHEQETNDRVTRQWHAEYDGLKARAERAESHNQTLAGLVDQVEHLERERDALKAERDTAHKWIADVHKMLGRGTHGSAKMDMDCAISGLADVLIASRENSAAEAAATERAEAAEEALRRLRELIQHKNTCAGCECLLVADDTDVAAHCLDCNPTEEQSWAWLMRLQELTASASLAFGVRGRSGWGARGDA